MTEKQPSRRTSLETVYNRVIEVFQFDKDKALTWYLSDLPAFGMSPYQMCKQGKARKVLRYLNKVQLLTE